MAKKIVIVGLGGVGGYFGGFLAKKYVGVSDIEIYFIARGEHLEKVKKNGLVLITENETFTVHPTLATDNILEIGITDYIIMSPKSYDLESTIQQIRPAVGQNTVILPLLNGIDNSDRIRKMLPTTEVWDGCCYIVSKIIEPGVIQNVGNIHRIVFGYNNTCSERLLWFEKLMLDAGIEIKFHEDILTEIWKKFFFISTSASLTSYFDVSYAEVINNPSRKAMLVDFSSELINVAIAEGVKIDHREIERLILQFEKLPASTTTSMHRDFMAKKRTEVKTLTGIVVKLAEKKGIDVPLYKKVYTELLNRSAI